MTACRERTLRHRLATALALAALALDPCTPPALAQSAFEDVFKAVEADRAAELRTLLARGIDVNTADRDGNTLLALAARLGTRETFSVLLAAGARLDSRNRFGETPLMHAALGGNESIVRALLARPVRVNPESPGWTPLHYAAWRNHTGIMSMLVERGANLNAVSSNGTTPLMMAASEGRFEAVTFLLGKGADPARVNDLGKTAASWAREGQHRRIAELIEARASEGKPKDAR